MFGPARLPPAIAERLNKEINKIPQWRCPTCRSSQALNIEYTPNSPWPRFADYH